MSLLILIVCNRVQFFVVTLFTDSFLLPILVFTSHEHTLSAQHAYQDMPTIVPYKQPVVAKSKLTT